MLSKIFASLMILMLIVGCSQVEETPTNQEVVKKAESKKSQEDIEGLDLAQLKDEVMRLREENQKLDDLVNVKIKEETAKIDDINEANKKILMVYEKEMKKLKDQVSHQLVTLKTKVSNLKPNTAVPSKQKVDVDGFKKIIETLTGERDALKNELKSLKMKRSQEAKKAIVQKTKASTESSTTKKTSSASDEQKTIESDLAKALTLEDAADRKKQYRALRQRLSDYYEKNKGKKGVQSWYEATLQKTRPLIR